MRNFKLIGFYCLLCPLASSAQHATVQGLSPEWYGQAVVLSRLSNPFDQSYEEIDRDTIDASGNFSLQADLDSAAQLWLSVYRFRAPLVLSPGAQVSIALADRPGNALAAMWKPGELQYAILEASDSLPLSIAQYDRGTYEFYVANAPLMGTAAFKREAQTFVATHTGGLNAYDSLHRAYSGAKMLLNAGVARETICDTYLSTVPHWNHPAGFTFVQTFFKKYFDYYEVHYGGASIAYQLSNGLGYRGLDSLLRRDSCLEAKPLRQLVMATALAQVRSDARYPLPVIRGMLDSLIHRAATPEVAQYAKLVDALFQPTSIAITELLKRSTGAEKPPCAKPTLLYLTLNQTRSSAKEHALLVDLYSQYSDVFCIWQVDVGGKNPESPWPVVQASNPSVLLEALEVYSFPQFFWIDQQGDLMPLAAESPSSGLERHLYEWKIKAEEAAKIKVGQR